MSHRSHQAVIILTLQSFAGRFIALSTASSAVSVAIKVMPEAFSKDRERLARFEREARLLASLNHPNVGAIYGVEESEGVRFLVLELVPGETLSERIAKGPMAIDEALPVFKQIAEGLEAAH